jgi:ammonium transporter Rh
MITAPVYAILTGMLSGLLSAVGFLKIGPYLKQRITLSDTCGVHNLHGMPAILGCIISAISADVMNANTFKNIAET